MVPNKTREGRQLEMSDLAVPTINRPSHEITTPKERGICEWIHNHFIPINL